MIDDEAALRGRVTRLTYPFNADNTRSWVDYTYDAVGRMRSVRDPSTTYAAFAYNADDLTKSIALGNQINDSFAYNGRACAA